MKELVYGVGINDADYVIRKREHFYVNGKRHAKNTWECPFYSKWAKMLYRCYHKGFLESNPTYKGCSVTAEWLRFSNFKAWMETQDWEGKQLDKDILFPGNRLYSAETCVFVSQRVNKFLVIKTMSGKYLTGVSWKKDRRKYAARCSNPFIGKVVMLGEYKDMYEAHNVWFEYKLKLAYDLIREESLPDVVSSALVQRVMEMKHTLV